MVAIGDVVKVLGYRGISRPTRLAKVVGLRDIHGFPLKSATYWYHRIKRSQLLVTVQYGPDEYRSYYTEFLWFRPVPQGWASLLYNRLLGWWRS